MSEDATHHEETTEQPATLHELTEEVREKRAAAEDWAKGTLTSTGEYLAANPWVAVAGAVVVGATLAALLRPKPRPATANLDLIREWLDEAYAKLPSAREVQRQSRGLTSLLKQVGHALHIA